MLEGIGQYCDSTWRTSTSGNHVWGHEAYMRTTKFSIILMSDSGDFDTHKSLINVSVAFGNLPQVFHAVFFPFPRSLDTKLQPVKAYQKSTVLHISSPKALIQACTASHLRSFPLPIQSKVLSPNPRMNIMQLQQHQYVQSLLSSFFSPSLDISSACRNILSSASSFLHGSRYLVSMWWLPTTVSPLVATIVSRL